MSLAVPEAGKLHDRRGGKPDGAEVDAGQDQREEALGDWVKLQGCALAAQPLLGCVGHLSLQKKIRPASWGYFLIYLLQILTLGKFVYLCGPSQTCVNLDGGPCCGIRVKTLPAKNKKKHLWNM